MQRLFYGNEWHWEYTRNNLRFGWDSLGQYIESIEKGGVRYQLSATGTTPAVFIHDTYRITQQESGYLWEDKFRNWMAFGLTGRMISFGSRIGVLGKLVYEEGESGRLMGIADRNDRQVFWFEYISDNRIAAVRDGVGRRVEYGYTGSHLTSVKDVLGNLTLYEYDATGRLVKSTDSGGRPTFISYDAYGNVSQVVDRFGKGDFFQYDYDAGKNEYYAQIRTSSGMIKEVWYDGDGETRRVDVNGRTIKKIVKDSRDLVVTDEKGNTTRKYYDEWDNLTKVIYPDGSSASFEYEHTFNKLTRARDFLGNVDRVHLRQQGQPEPEGRSRGRELRTEDHVYV